MSNTCLKEPQVCIVLLGFIYVEFRIYALKLLADVLYDVFPFASEGKSETDIDEVGESDIDKMHDLARQHGNKTVVTDIDTAEEGSGTRMVIYFICFLFSPRILKLFIWDVQ